MASIESTGEVTERDGQEEVPADVGDTKSPVRDRTRSLSSQHLESGQRVRSSRSHSRPSRGKRHRHSSMESKRSQRRSCTPVRSRRRSRSRKRRKYRRSSVSSYSPSPRRSRGRRRRRRTSSLSSSPSPRKLRVRRRQRRHSRSLSYSPSPRRSRDRRGRRHHSRRYRTASEDRSRIGQQVDHQTPASHQGQYGSHGYSAGYGWYGNYHQWPETVEQFTSHLEYPGWVVSDKTGIWYPVSAQQEQAAVGTNATNTPAATSTASPGVAPTATAGATKAQEGGVAKYPLFEPISDVEGEPSARQKR